ncbi:hypothetical protein ONZ45_g17570 [Pleurotus djamor]|nr:hypothetical protein ONZ45_g17570 [Pleurotus djamor]
MSSNTTNNDNDDARTPIEIAWSSIAVIFACTWIAIHPNIPPVNIRASQWLLWRRRVFLMLWALLVPELMIQWAVKQWFDALDVSRRQRRAVKNSRADSEMQKKIDFFSDIVLGKEDRPRGTSAARDVEEKGSNEIGGRISENNYWKKSQSFFFAMGGFTIHQNGQEIRPLRMDDMQATSPDPSPSSSGFLSIETLSPSSSHLIPWPDRMEAEINDKSKGDSLAKMLVILQTTWYLIQLLARRILKLEVTEIEIVALAYSFICGLLYLFWWSKPLDAQEPIKVPLPPNYSLRNLGHSGRASPREPEAWYEFIIMILCGDFIFRLHGKIIDEPADDYSELATDAVEGTLSRRKKVSLAVSGAAATLFGGIHCIGWNFTFPSNVERLIWNISSVVISTVPLAWTLILLILWALDQAKNSSDNPAFVRLIRYFAIYPTLFLLSVALYSYFVARVVLIVEAFTLLRNLPPGAREKIPWADFIPHI